MAQSWHFGKSLPQEWHEALGASRVANHFIAAFARSRLKTFARVNCRRDETSSAHKQTSTNGVTVNIAQRNLLLLARSVFAYVSGTITEQIWSTTKVNTIQNRGHQWVRLIKTLRLSHHWPTSDQNWCRWFNLTKQILFGPNNIPIAEWLQNNFGQWQRIISSKTETAIISISSSRFEWAIVDRNPTQTERAGSIYWTITKQM